MYKHYYGEEGRPEDRKPTEKPPEPGPVEVLVIFPEPADDPWEAILAEKTPRPAFMKLVKKVEKQIAAGKATPLDLDQL